jgi:hypothetical protein
MTVREPATITTTETITVESGDSWRDIQSEYDVTVNGGMALVRNQGDSTQLVLREDIQQPFIDNWPFDEVRPFERGAVYDLLWTYDGQLNKLDQEITEVNKQKFIDTATGRSLDYLAEEVGVIRETGESDERLRFRTQIAKAIPQSTTDILSFAELLRVLFGEDATNISLTTQTDDPVVVLTIPESTINEVPLTRQELENEFQQVVPSGDNVIIQQKGQFSFEGSAFGKGFGEGTWK